LAKTKAIFEDEVTLKAALGALGGVKMAGIIKEAGSNLIVFKGIWTQPNTELDSIKIDESTITIGQVYSYFIRYIERQADLP
jgi:hypothetical protein